MKELDTKPDNAQKDLPRTCGCLSRNPRVHQAHSTCMHSEVRSGNMFLSVRGSTRGYLLNHSQRVGSQEHPPGGRHACSLP